MYVYVCFMQVWMYVCNICIYVLRMYINICIYVCICV